MVSTGSLASCVAGERPAGSAVPAPSLAAFRRIQVGAGALHVKHAGPIPAYLSLPACQPACWRSIPSDYPPSGSRQTQGCWAAGKGPPCWPSLRRRPGCCRRAARRCRTPGCTAWRSCWLCGRRPWATTPAAWRCCSSTAASPSWHRTAVSLSVGGRAVPRKGSGWLLAAGCVGGQGAHYRHTQGTHLPAPPPPSHNLRHSIPQVSRPPAPQSSLWCGTPGSGITWRSHGQPLTWRPAPTSTCPAQMPRACWLRPLVRSGGGGRPLRACRRCWPAGAAGLGVVGCCCAVGP